MHHDHPHSHCKQHIMRSKLFRHSSTSYLRKNVNQFRHCMPRESNVENKMHVCFRDLYIAVQIHKGCWNVIDFGERDTCPAEHHQFLLILIFYVLFNELCAFCKSVKENAISWTPFSNYYFTYVEDQKHGIVHTFHSVFSNNRVINTRQFSSFKLKMTHAELYW